MIKQNIQSQSQMDCCSKCKKFSSARIELSRIDLLYQKNGYLLAPDLFNRIYCRKCFILQIENCFNELQQPTRKKSIKSSL